MSQLFLIQWIFEGGKQKNISGKVPSLRILQDILTVSAGKWCGLAPEPAVNGRTSEKRQAGEESF